MGKYVDGYVVVAKKGKLNAYKKMASQAGKTWIKHGALEYFECVEDDMNPKMGDMKQIGFPKMIRKKPGEKVIFAYIVYKSRKHRDSVNKKVAKEFEKDKDKWKNMEMPFDMKRFAYGGFKTIVERKR